MKRNLLQVGEQWLAKMQRKHTSTRVTYARVEASCSPCATIGRSEHDITSPVENWNVRVATLDFIIARAELVLDGICVSPNVGDRIIHCERTYQVAEPGEGIPHWKWDGPHQTRYRIHTRLVDETQ